MYQYIINGKQKLNGEINVYGDKNTALKLIPATILSDEPCKISNIPDITDVKIMIQIMEDLGTKVEKVNENTYIFDNSTINKTIIDPSLAKKLRASTVLIGPMLAKFKEVSIPHPGGCIIGKRPIDIHLEAFKKLGANITADDEYYHISTDGLKGATIIPHSISVTGTENIIMAACMAEGETIVEYSACEPSVIQLSEYLNARGAKIEGAGNPRIKITGVKSLKGGDIEVIPDRIEAGTFIILGALCGDINVKNINPSHLEVFLKILTHAGVKMERGENNIKVYHSTDLKATSITTSAYPGFPTDLQAPFTLLMTQAHGISMIHETIFEGRLSYTEWLNMMGANIVPCDPHRVLVSGPTPLYGKKIVSPDIRAGIALVMASLIAQGQSHIDNIDLVDRGYANLDERLTNLGASIERNQIN